MQEKFKPRGQPLTLVQLFELATIRQSSVDEMVKRSHPTLKPFVNAVPVRPSNS
ncbi:hypothetical protein ACE1AT_04685 [Pelatocladus sp. BLCC-F211]|uniref:hypothetical protein n=1 Tax=Pelatocladus sp. BLCC-F211 TaxID=3342752 RepID=UPI0035BAB512